jgi:hypothetical protein
MWKGSHPILPVMMHHFGCAVPSHEGLMIVKILAEGGSGGGAGGGKHKTKGEEAAKTQRPNKNKKRKVVDMGSGNGYWTMMLRGYGVEVDAVDNGMSKWFVLRPSPFPVPNLFARSRLTIHIYHPGSTRR